MELLSRILEPQNYLLAGEVCILIAIIVAFTAYGIKVVTDLPAAMVVALLAIGGYGGNVLARAAEIIAVTNNITFDIVLDSTYATFAGMAIVMVVWFVNKLVLPAVVEPRKLVRPNEPKAVVGRVD